MSGSRSGCYRFYFSKNRRPSILVNRALTGSGCGVFGGSRSLSFGTILTFGHGTHSLYNGFSRSFIHTFATLAFGGYSFCRWSGSCVSYGYYYPWADNCGRFFSHFWCCSRFLFRYGFSGTGCYSSLYSGRYSLM